MEQNNYDSIKQFNKWWKDWMNILQESICNKHNCNPLPRAVGIGMKIIGYKDSWQGRFAPFIGFRLKAAIDILFTTNPFPTAIGRSFEKVSLLIRYNASVVELYWLNYLF